MTTKEQLCEAATRGSITDLVEDQVAHVAKQLCKTVAWGQLCNGIASWQLCNSIAWGPVSEGMHSLLADKLCNESALTNSLDIDITEQLIDSCLAAEPILTYEEYKKSGKQKEMVIVENQVAGITEHVIDSHAEKPMHFWEDYKREEMRGAMIRSMKVINANFQHKAGAIKQILTRTEGVGYAPSCAV